MIIGYPGKTLKIPLLLNVTMILSPLSIGRPCGSVTC
jgi:hypothetical protein